ncbi:hypothetical protein PI86_07890 [Burkholderia sp. A9]|uniref:hypothetical protein n=1 Tax=Burkholderia sp. A9 TaxID=1365108 RepID=UPI00057387CE|nr:hypothetical protein [Burkholderia sp. A9]KHK59728.1 hypothetical protein PI86_07890 [Burkholderia sp. A9]
MSFVGIGVFASSVNAASKRIQPGYMFYATPEQKANVEMYTKDYPGGVGANVPSGSAIASSTSREQAYCDAYAKGTIGAAVIVVGGPTAAWPGTPTFSTAGALGSGALASPVGMGAISAGVQYMQGGTINSVDVAGAFGTGVAGSYGGLLWNVGVNTIGGAMTTALNDILQGKNDSVIGSPVSSGVLSSQGYGLGKLGESGVNSVLK